MGTNGVRLVGDSSARQKFYKENEPWTPSWWGNVMGFVMHPGWGAIVQAENERRSFRRRHNLFGLVVGDRGIPLSCECDALWMCEKHALELLVGHLLGNA